MSRESVADALDRAAEAIAQAAHELRGTEPAAPPAVQDRVPSRPAAAEAGVPPAPASAPPTADKCPKHNKPFTQSKNPEWPNFCSSLTDDPAWGKPKVDKDGNPVLYCRITNRNAPEWVGLHKTAAAMDVDDVPF